MKIFKIIRFCFYPIHFLVFSQLFHLLFWSANKIINYLVSHLTKISVSPLLVAYPTYRSWVAVVTQLKISGSEINGFKVSLCNESRQQRYFCHLLMKYWTIRYAAVATGKNTNLQCRRVHNSKFVFSYATIVAHEWYCKLKKNYFIEKRKKNLSWIFYEVIINLSFLTPFPSPSLILKLFHLFKISSSPKCPFALLLVSRRIFYITFFCLYLYVLFANLKYQLNNKLKSIILK